VLVLVLGLVLVPRRPASMRITSTHEEGRTRKKQETEEGFLLLARSKHCGHIESSHID
jgi:hypothetical protein